MYPETPTFIDLGYKTWVAAIAAIIAPRGLPAPIVKKLHDAFKEAMSDPGYLRVTKNLNIEVSYSGLEDLSKEIKALDEQYARTAKDMGLKKE
jgi:tripartite-type tricarboxylate transporter receptor subunit TctC